MEKFIPKEKMSKKARAALLKEHRKPPIPPSRRSESKAEFLKKKDKIAKQRGYID